VIGGVVWLPGGGGGGGGGVWLTGGVIAAVSINEPDINSGIYACLETA
jgi:hypothetical protein